MKCLRKPPAARAKCLRALPAHRPTRDVESTLGEEGMAARWVLQRPDVAWFNDRGPYGGGANTAASWTAAVDADDRPFGDRARAVALLAKVKQEWGGDLLAALNRHPLVATDTGHLLDGWHRLYLWVKSGLPGGPPTLVMVPGKGGLGRVSDLCTGKDLGRQGWDYSCVLPPALRTKDYTLRVEVGPSGNYVRASLHHPTALLRGEVGFASGTRSGTDLVIGEITVNPAHAGGKGVPLYEALFSHAFHRMGVKRIVGALHSTSAHRVHEKLAAKHGLKYSAAPNVEKASAASGEYDEKWGPYGYPLAGADDPRTAIFKQCSCGRAYTKSEWERLPILGHQLTDDEHGRYDLELRNCPSCGSTMGVERKTHDGAGRALGGLGARVPVSEVLAFYAKVSPSQHLVDRIKPHPEWELARISTTHLKIDPGYDAAKASSYAQMSSRPPPIIAIPGTLEWEVLDGNHRAAAALESGKKTVLAYVPARSAGPLSVRRASVGLRGLGEPAPDRAALFSRFQDAVRHVWRTPEFVLPAITLSPEEPTNPVFASITFNPQGVWASGNSLLRRAPVYTLRVSDRLLTADPETQWKILVHEAVHLGYPRHDRGFRDLCREKGGTVSEEALDGQGIKAEKKVGSRYQVVRTFSDEREATRWAKEQQRAEPGSRWRLSLGGVGDETAPEIPFSAVRAHIVRTNPHRGTPRDAMLALQQLNELAYRWYGPVLLNPNDPKFAHAGGVSKRDIARYSKLARKGSPIPAIVVTDEGFRYAVHDGSHRLSAAREVGVPIDAFVGRPGRGLDGLGATKAACPSWDFDPNTRSSIWVRPDGCAINAGEDHGEWAKAHLGLDDGFTAMQELMKQGWLRFHVYDAQLNVHMTKVPTPAQVRTLDHYARYPGVTIGMTDVEYGGQMRYLSNADGHVTAGRIAAFARKYLSGLGGLGSAPIEWWHGSPSGDLRGGPYGLHVGSRLAARQALNARVGTPVEGEWDGTREYGKTLLAGQKTLQARGLYATGYSTSAPEEDHLPTGEAKFGDGSPVLPTHRPNLFQVQIVGPMSNTPYKPMEDARANGLMHGQIKRGRAIRGYYYTNVGEDSGSISAVLPGPEHVARV